MDHLAAHRAYLRGWSTQSSDDDLVTYRSDVAHATLNGVLRTRGRPTRQALDQARERLHGVPRIWWVGPDSDPGTANDLRHEGATPLTQLPIMVVDPEQAARPPTVAGLEIEETTNITEYAAAYARVSGIDPRPRRSAGSSAARPKTWPATRGCVT
ncbi:hypothetical protein, partial [Asanoa sp. NPDC050611]|uniref:hypothetical protein n=1 Tax=Asanoa sp. NPDC050611 TaxID=3157098 RepID=UPI0033C6AB92